MRILFVDAKSSTPYDSAIMRAEGIGGTEQSVVRVAEGLAAHHEVAVAQLGRSVPATVGGVRYLPLSASAFGAAAPDHVIVLRKHKLLADYRRRFPQAALYSWIHNWQRPEAALKRSWRGAPRPTVITVSDAHLRNADRTLNGLGGRLLRLSVGSLGRVPLRRIYNPIDSELRADGSAINADQMIFLSTPNKGLMQVLENFRVVRERLPSIELLVAGASAQTLQAIPALGAALAQPGVRLLGRLPQTELLRHVRASLCVFYPQSQHPETFGLIFAEANAVGTPVMAHDFGAAREVLGGDEQLVDARDPQAVAAKIAQWREGQRPRVGAQPQFHTTAVVAEWRRLLEEGR